MRRDPSCHRGAEALGSTVIGALTASAVAALSVLVGGIPRVLLASDALPGWLRPFVWSDVLHLWERGVRDDHLPYVGAFFEYPPLAGGIWALVQSLVGSATAFVAAWLVIQASAAALAAFVLARSAGARRATVFWAATPQLVLHGSTNIDVLASAALVIAIVEARRTRYVSSAVALAAGATLKLFPTVALPALLARAPRSAALRAGLAFSGLCVAAFGATAFVAYPSVTSLIRYSVGIGANPDSVWGLLAMTARGLGGIDPAGWIVAVTLLGTAATYTVALAATARRAGDAAIRTALCVLAVLLWSRLYSPQYALWILPFFALLPVSWRPFAAMTTADLAVVLSVYPLTLVAWPIDHPMPALLLGVLAGAVILRHIALIAAWREIWALRATTGQ